MPHIGFLIISLLMVSLPVACSTVTPLESPYKNNEVVNEIQPGSILKITLKSGDEYTIAVSSISNEEIKGENQGETFKLEDIVRIDKIKPTLVGKAFGYGTGFTLGVLYMDAIFAIIDSIILW